MRPTRISPCPPQFEPLEQRIMLSVTQIAPMADVTAEPTTAMVIDLGDHFIDDQVPGTLVEVDTVMGTFYMAMYDGITPQTVANFLQYVDDGDFEDMFFHRLVKGFVLQGGSFTFPEGAGVPGNVPTDAPVVNEFANWYTTSGGPLAPGTPLNVRGTVAMAKVGGDPDSATSGFFVNLNNNSGNLDNQNGGFTVFAHVPYGMNVIDTIAALTVINAGGAFTEMPVDNFTPPTVQRENLVLTEGVRVVSAITYSVSSSKPGVLAATIDGDGDLVLTPQPGRTGTVTVTVRATDTAGNQITETFTVSVPPVLFTLAAIDGTANEDGDTAVFTVSRTGSDDAPTQVKLTMQYKKKVRKKMRIFRITGDATVNVSGGGSYANNMLTIPAGHSSVTVTIVPIGDAKIEATERFKVVLKAGTGQAVSALATERATTITITDNDPTVAAGTLDAATLFGLMYTLAGDEPGETKTEPAAGDGSVIDVLALL